MSAMHYVIGFAFSSSADRVVLIQKDHPEWQAGRWNGVGGKVERDESLTAAMVREFEEETGVTTESGDWQVFLILDGPGYCCSILRMFNSERISHAKTRTSEEVATFALDRLPTNVVTPLGWLVPLAADRNVAPGTVVWRKA